ncbi:hypothetical protein [Ramlibacter sp. 2FC]|uniref:hypothetical protein n=1 Tax=Ramlibacter sp. 2FC TaxID=2502188 RepID=UPI0010F8101C|nr:hypothetical protein [Ramlibacter sp. 2FC]
MKQKPVGSRSREAVSGSAELKKNPLKGKTVVASEALRKEGRYLLVGAGTVLDVGGSHLKCPSLGSLSDDVKILQRDFWTVGDDLRTVLQYQLSNLKR